MYNLKLIIIYNLTVYIYKNEHTDKLALFVINTRGQQTNTNSLRTVSFRKPVDTHFRVRTV